MSYQNNRLLSLRVSALTLAMPSDLFAVRKVMLDLTNTGDVEGKWKTEWMKPALLGQK